MYINERIKDEKYFFCRYSEFHALRRSSGNLLPDDRLSA